MGVTGLGQCAEVLVVKPFPYFDFLSKDGFWYNGRFQITRMFTKVVTGS